jgi:hypothetical protein
MTDDDEDDPFVFVNGNPIAMESDTTSSNDIEEAVQRAQSNWKRDAWLALPPLLGLAFTSWRAFGLIGLVVPVVTGVVSLGGVAYIDRKQKG